MAAKDTTETTPQMLLHAYGAGIFPMADGRDLDEVFWVDPTERGIMPLGKFHISRSLAREIRKERFSIRINSAFPDVVRACAGRDETWINDTIFDLYLTLHKSGFAHSLEIWEDDVLVGGVYGVAIGGAFFGESMFSHRTNASKIALAYLVDRLRLGGFSLFDTQFITDHLRSLGAIEISRDAYRDRLKKALHKKANFFAQPSSDVSASGVLHRNTQTS